MQYFPRSLVLLIGNIQIANMTTMKIWKLAFAMFAAFSLASCSSEAEWADSEAHEKTVLLREQYTPLIAGTWHLEHVADRVRFFESLTFNSDGTLKGMRKWQIRSLVTIDGQERYTDWQEVDGENGPFAGTWQLSWSREAEYALGGNRMMLTASFDEARDWPSPMAYSLNARFISVDEAVLCIGGGIVRNGQDGTTTYSRGNAEP